MKKNWKFLLPLSLMGFGLVIMLITALCAHSLSRIASWPSVTLGPIRVMIFGELEDSINQEALNSASYLLELPEETNVLEESEIK